MRTSSVVLGAILAARSLAVRSDAARRLRENVLARARRNGQLAPEQRTWTWAPAGTLRTESAVTRA
jgi:hypothetical protein